MSKDIPAFHVAAGNPAKIIRKIETAMDSNQQVESVPANETVKQGVENILKSE